MPWIELDGAVNVRDLGGLATQHGGQTVGGRLLRGDNLQELSAADVARLVDDIGLTTVVDLRSTAELNGRGPGAAAGRGQRPACASPGSAGAGFRYRHGRRCAADPR